MTASLAKEAEALGHSNIKKGYKLYGHWVGNAPAASTRATERSVLGKQDGTGVSRAWVRICLVGNYAGWAEGNGRGSSKLGRGRAQGPCRTSYGLTATT